ncbi:neutral amino acid transporter A-like [Ornithodoros turicata]|uniref:neutral amino acid transporter A-like n=1 Tax=Ornithodoros turicata TaxID=34597 RepID=UPI0031398F2C
MPATAVEITGDASYYFTARLRRKDKSKRNQVAFSPDDERSAIAPLYRKYTERCLHPSAILNTLMVIGVAAGVAGGICLRKYYGTLTARQLMYLAFPGEMFLRLVGQASLPFVTASVMSAIGSMKLATAGVVGLCTIIYFISTTLIAEAIGITVALVVQAGEVNTTIVIYEDALNVTFHAVDVFLDVIRNMAPPNIIQACLYTWRTNAFIGEASNDTGNWTYEDFTVDTVRGANIAGLLSCSVVIGLILAVQSTRQGMPLIRVLVAFSDATLIFVSWVLWLGPIGVAFLIAHQIVVVPDVYASLMQVQLFVTTVLIGIGIHMFIFLPAVYVFYVGIGTLCDFILVMVMPLLAAFGTSSSTASIAVTVPTLEGNLQLDPRVVRVVVPIGASLNMDGTAIYEAAAAVFFAQRHGVRLDAANMSTVMLAAFLATMSAATVPGGSFAAMSLVLSDLGIPIEEGILIFGIDWLVDRFCTVLNVASDAVGAAVLHSRYAKRL